MEKNKKNKGTATNVGTSSILNIQVDVTESTSSAKKGNHIYPEIIAHVRDLFPQLEIVERASYTAFYHKGKKIGNINHSNATKMFYHYPNADLVAKAIKQDNLRPVDKNEAQRNRWGAVRAIYEGNCIETALLPILVWANNLK